MHKLGAEVLWVATYVGISLCKSHNIKILILKCSNWLLYHRITAKCNNLTGTVYRSSSMKFPSLGRSDNNIRRISVEGAAALSAILGFRFIPLLYLFCLLGAYLNFLIFWSCQVLWNSSTATVRAMSFWKKRPFCFPTLGLLGHLPTMTSRVLTKLVVLHLAASRVFAFRSTSLGKKVRNFYRYFCWYLRPRLYKPPALLTWQN